MVAAAGLLALVLTGCGEKDEKPAANAPAPANTAAPAPATNAAPAPANNAAPADSQQGH